jgi:hypothetical protein
MATLLSQQNGVGIMEWNILSNGQLLIILKGMLSV